MSNENEWSRLQNNLNSRRGNWKEKLSPELRKRLKLAPYDCANPDCRKPCEGEFIDGKVPRGWLCYDCKRDPNIRRIYVNSRT